MIWETVTDSLHRGFIYFGFPFAAVSIRAGSCIVAATTMNRIQLKGWNHLDLVYMVCFRMISYLLFHMSINTHSRDSVEVHTSFWVY